VFVVSKSGLFKGLISTEKEFQKVSNQYAYTKQDVEKVFHEMEEELFASRTPGADDESVPKMLVVVGVEGAGKTHLLNELLKTSRYSNYVPLYEPEYRTRHPHYDEIEKHGVVYAYKQTEAFIRDLGAMIFEKSLEDKYSIIMEAGLETREFAGFQTGEHSCLYEYEVHVIASKKDFAHVSTIVRALDCVKGNKLERFVSLRDIDAGMANAKAVLTAFEEACSRVQGSEIMLYERNFGTDKNSRMICRSQCVKVGELTPQPITNGSVSIPAASNKVRVEYKSGVAVFGIYKAFSDVADGAIFHRYGREKMVLECHTALAGTHQLDRKDAELAVNDLYSYILKYTIR
jgi:guanylate kinase